MPLSSESRPLRSPAYIGYEQLPMCGVNVQLPSGLKPYPTQKLMMIKILTSLRNHLHALIESPTGSGKTLALLASSLAWLADYKRQRTESRDKCPVHRQNGAGNKRAAVAVSDSACAATEQKAVVEKENSETSNADGSTLPPDDNRESVSPDAFLNAEEEYDRDFLPETAGKRRATLNADASSSSGKRSRLSKEAEEVETGCSCMPRVRIYYGTRTHKQISQVVKEFGRLPYAGEIKHTILASREQSCINKKARASGDLTGYCKELHAPDGGGCSYHNALRPKYDKDYKMRNYLNNKAPAAWDIEDLVTALSAAAPSAMCPYFASNRVLNEDADIIFCPFNYLIDPIIRDASDMKLKNSVVILDEAHNVEDTCRDAASFAFSEKEICDALTNLRDTHQKTKDALSQTRLTSEGREVLSEFSEYYIVTVAFVEELQRWFKDVGSKVDIKATGAVKYTAILTWVDLNAALLYDGGDPRRVNLLFKDDSEEYKTLFTALSTLMGKNDKKDAEKEDELKGYRPAPATAVLIEKFYVFLKYYTTSNYNTTYRTFISIERNEPSMQRNNKRKSFEPSIQVRNADEWLSARSAPTGDYHPILPGYNVTVNLWCMSPAVSFLDAFHESRSVILASGTLCPTETFQTELGVDFKA
uniref:Helicase ATP-binding domain-containing protein n=1 Tax=Plectus sambesii TaxID=2011161 RepID=A0A914W936_9BILA